MGLEPRSASHSPPSTPSQDWDPGWGNSGVWAAVVAAQALHTGRKCPSALSQAHLFEGLYLQTYTPQISDGGHPGGEALRKGQPEPDVGHPDAWPNQIPDF